MKTVPLHPDDAASLMELRLMLRDTRIAANISGYRLSKLLNRNMEFVSNLERTANTSPPFMSSLQAYAAGLDMRVEFGIDNFWMVPHIDKELANRYAASRPWGADEAFRHWFVWAVRAWRISRGIDVMELAPLLGTDVASVRRWEHESRDPVMSRAMAHARHTGTRVTWRLWRKDEWIFG